jgi:hypothetical protein
MLMVKSLLHCYMLEGALGNVVVKALCYKLERRGFEAR